MGITEILRRIRLIAANKIKSSSHCRTQVIIAAEIRHNWFAIVAVDYLCFTVLNKCAGAKISAVCSEGASYLY